MDKTMIETQLKGIREKRVRILDQIELSQKKVELLELKIKQLEKNLEIE